MPASASKMLDLQPRDLQLLHDLLVSRLMTLAQAAAIHFGGKSEMTKKRVQKLKAAGFLGARERKAYQPSILYLTRCGYDLLRDRGLLVGLPSMPWTAVEKRLNVSDLTLRHELEVMTVKAAFFASVRDDPSLHIEEFITWPLLNQFQSVLRDGSDVLVKPDGFIRIRQQLGQELFEHVFYLELDRSTETLDTLARRAQAYLAHYQSGGLAKRFGHDFSEYKAFPFRVLMVFKTAERRNNMAERLLAGSPPVLTHSWLSTADDVAARPLAGIWVRPLDYRDFVDQTNLGNRATRSSPVYRRRAHHDQSVERLVNKSSLIGAHTPDERIAPVT